MSYRRRKSTAISKTIIQLAYREQFDRQATIWIQKPAMILTGVVVNRNRHCHRNAAAMSIVKTTSTFVRTLWMILGMALLTIITTNCHAFLHSTGRLAYHRQTHKRTIESPLFTPRGLLVRLYQQSNSSDDEDDAKEEYINPYADPNYPDLEFVDYSDPSYSSDRSEYFADIDDDENDDDWKTEQEIEKLREERRRQNDEYQYQVYYRDVLRNGAKFYGEWQVYETSTFQQQKTKQQSSSDHPQQQQPPRLIRRPVTLAVQSSAHKRILENNDDTTTTISTDLNDREHIQHWEKIVIDPGIGEFLAQQQEQQTESDDDTNSEQSSLPTYWPEELRARDFRGHQGIMVCGK
jgi:hypothetical protein